MQRERDVNNNLDYFIKLYQHTRTHPFLQLKASKRLSHYIYLGTFYYELMLRMFPNTLVYDTTRALSKAFKNNKTPLWRALEKELAGSRANRREVTVRRLAEVTSPNEVVAIPGKVLGTGSIGHKLTVCAFSISQAAAKKVIESGGKVITFDDLIKKHPDGKGVRIIG
jgi:large subunit ribosomal protein L18e